MIKNIKKQGLIAVYDEQTTMIRSLYEGSDFNFDQALSYTDFDTDMLEDLLRCFVDILPDQIQELQEAFEQNDTESIDRITHTLKSNASIIGATTLSQACSEVNLSLKKQVPIGSSTQMALLQELKSTYRQIALVIDQEPSLYLKTPSETPLPDLVRALLLKCRNSELIDKRFLHLVVEHLKDDGFNELADHLSNRLSQYNYDEAIVLLETYLTTPNRHIRID